MKNFTFFVFLFIYQYAHSQGIGIGSTSPPHPSAALDVNSTNKGLLIPRMTTAERNAIATPSIGLQVFDTTTNSFWYFNGTAWTNVYVGNFSLPFVGTGTSSTDLFSITNSGSGEAIYGQSNSGKGVFGKSTSSAGVKGQSSSSIGVYGLSTSNHGVYGFSTSGRGGSFENISNVNPALYVGNAGTGGAARFDGKVLINDNLEVDGSITVNTGKGIVSSTNSTQLKMRRTTISLATTLAANTTADSGYLTFGFAFSAVSILIGNVRNGSTGDYGKVFLVPFDMDYTNDRCRFKVTNVSSSSITFDASWDIVLVGQ